LTRKIAGDERPKQFCSVLGKSSLLEETRNRAALELSPERTLYVLNRLHQPYYHRILGNTPHSQLIVQPQNRGTAPAIVYTLLRIAAVDPRALVAFFPSDHYISDDERFMGHLRSALDAARGRRDLVILLGIEPENPEVEYGWIEPARPIDKMSRVFGVRRFWEKPNELLAQVLQLRGCLWNSFVMVASAHGLLDVIASAMPGLYRAFASLSHVLGTRSETRAIERLYDSIDETNFSHQLLARRPERLGVIKVTGVRWNDLGEPKRVMASLDIAGIRPHWVEAAIAQSA
jgi:mannose-1-phosphate guanylyltransferase